MPTFRLELYKGKPLSDGYFPITITVTHKGMPKRKTIASARPEQWLPPDKKHNGKIKAKSRIDAEQLNRLIEENYDKYHANFKKLRDSKKDWNPQDVFDSREEKVETSMFKENALAYLETLAGKSQHSYDSADSRYRKILRYTNSKDFDIEAISEKWLAGFISHCKTKEKNKDGGIGNSDNTINYAIRFIKRVKTFAGAESKVLSNKKLSFSETVVDFISMEEYHQIWALDITPHSNRWHARNFFSLAIFLRGIRVGDLIQLEFTDIRDGRIIYDASKTGKKYDIELLEPAKEILSFYEEADRDFVFPFYSWRYNDRLTKKENKKNKANAIKNGTSNINNNLYKISTLAKLDKKISTHKARHSFAVWSDEAGLSLPTIQGMLGHGNRRMTEIYIKRLRKTKDLDQAAASVFDSFKSKSPT